VKKYDYVLTTCFNFKGLWILDTLYICAFFGSQKRKLIYLKIVYLFAFAIAPPYVFSEAGVE
jgi:hypothetical protein